MTDDVRLLTATLAADPSSLVFLELAEHLRRRGLAHQALAVTRHGLARYPSLAAAHDLHARVLCDLGEEGPAADAWRAALRAEPGHVSARKGLAFLDFRAGHAGSALAALEALAREVPDDAGVQLALATVRQAAGAVDDGSTPSGTAEGAVLFDPEFGAGEGVLLLDQQGLRLTGAVTRPDGADVTDRVAAHLAGVSHEAERAARLLGLGAWTSAAVEGSDGGIHLLPPTPGTLLVAARERSVPPGRLALFAERAADNARRWLEEIR